MKKIFAYKFWNFNVVLLLIIASLFFVGAAREVFDVTILNVKQVQPIAPDTSLKIKNAVMAQNWKEIGSATTVSLAKTDSDYILIKKSVGLASLTVNLPLIDSTMDGKVFTFKQVDSGTTPAVITPYAGYDAIESTKGTLSGVTDYVLNAIGEAKAWKAYYVGSGVSNYWVLLWTEQL